MAVDVPVVPGEIWWARPDTTVGREQAGRRPVLIVAGPAFLRSITELALVVPLTSVNRGWPNHIAVPESGGLDCPSWAMTEQVRVISRKRLTKRIGIVPSETLNAVREWIADFLYA